MEINYSDLKEIMYAGLADLALELLNNGRKMTCDEVIAWINKNFAFPEPYYSVRRVFQAAYVRTDDERQTALTLVFTDKYGRPLLD